MANIGLRLANSAWDEKEYAAMERVIRSGNFTMGLEVSKFEHDFADALGAKYAVMVNSGSSANLLIVAALRYHSTDPIPFDSEIIVPAVSWSTTYYPLHQYGLQQKFVDIDRDTLNYDLDSLSKAISEKTRAIMVVNLLGNPNDFAKIKEIIGKRDIVIIEDNCEALGAKFAGRSAGTFGIAGSYSTFYSHHISTMEGGVVTTDDEELYHIMLSVRAHGWTRNLPMTNRVTGVKSDNAFEESYRFVLPGYNLRPLELSGAIGQEQVRKLESIVSQRRRNAKTFLEVVSEFPAVRPQTEVGESSWFGFSLMVDDQSDLTRTRLLSLLAEAGIETRPIVAGNFVQNEVVNKYIKHEIHGNLTNAEYLNSHGLFIGNHHFAMDSEFEVLHDALRKI